MMMTEISDSALAVFMRQKDGTPFAKIENPFTANAELSVESKDGMSLSTCMR